MKYRILAIAMLVAAAPSCEKVKNIARKGRAAINSEIAAHSGEAESKEDPALAKLVDRTDDGVVFRMDLPFPTSLEVRTTSVDELSGRVFEQSEIGTGGSNVKGTATTISLLKRSGNDISYQLVESVFREPLAEGQDEEKQKKEQLAAPFTAEFRKEGAKWKPMTSDFHTASLVQSLSPVFDQLMVDNALAPHPMWFGKKRFKVGDTVSVSGKSLPMIVTGNATGNLELKLESFESVEGHPCGVFSVSGSFSRQGFPSFDGSLINEERTIETGKLWLSLLYPVVLREQENSIQTVSGAKGAGNARHVSGSAKFTVTREWKPLVK